MKYVLIYFIMAPGYGGASISQEFDDLKACEFAWSMVDRSFSASREHDEAFKTLTVVTCVPKGTDSK